MKASSAVLVVLVSAATSLATVSVLELLRAPTPAAERAPAETSSGGPGAPVVADPARDLRPVAPERSSADPSADLEARLVELERLVAELERGPVREPAPATGGLDARPPEDELRDLVLAWVSEDREARGRAAQSDDEDRRRAQREFSARYQAHMLAEEHGLADWQEEEFAELFLEMGQRSEVIEAGIDPSVDDPEEVEARWAAFDEWVDRRERELTARLDPALYEKIYGEDE